jgi:hypothetical protein
MAQRGTSHKVVGGIASATNRSEAEVRWAVGLAVLGAGVGLLLRTVRFLFDLGPRTDRDHRPRPSARPAVGGAASRSAR